MENHMINSVFRLESFRRPKFAHMTPVVFTHPEISPPAAYQLLRKRDEITHHEEITSHGERSTSTPSFLVNFFFAQQLRRITNFEHSPLGPCTKQIQPRIAAKDCGRELPTIKRSYYNSPIRHSFWKTNRSIRENPTYYTLNEVETGRAAPIQLSILENVSIEPQRDCAPYRGSRSRKSRTFDRNLEILISTMCFKYIDYEDC